jgi:hypothetical protein
MSEARIAHPPRWYLVPVRVLVATFIVALLSFAVTLFVGIVSLTVAGTLRGVAPNMTTAYRQVALPVAATVAAIVLVSATYMEIRSYRQSKALAGMENQMRA